MSLFSFRTAELISWIAAKIVRGKWIIYFALIFRRSDTLFDDESTPLKLNQTCRDCESVRRNVAWEWQDFASARHKYECIRSPGAYTHQSSAVRLVFVFTVKNHLRNLTVAQVCLSMLITSTTALRPLCSIVSLRHRSKSTSIFETFARLNWMTILYNYLNITMKNITKRDLY